MTKARWSSIVVGGAGLAVALCLLAYALQNDINALFRGGVRR